MIEWTDDRVEQLKRLWNEDGLSASAIAKRMGTTRGSILGKSTRLNLHFRKGRAITLDKFHPASIEARTLFPSQRHKPSGSVLKTGAYQRKIGGKIMKGTWAGMPVYALTLEERATCPRSCVQWLSCYGNGMHRAVRHEAGEMLELSILSELHTLQRNHPDGFVIRLHILGDFYSPRYVELWRDALDEFPALRVFGYTAQPEKSVIGGMIAALRNERWSRFSVRTSGASVGLRANVYDTAKDVPAGEIICPAQVNKTKSCATCGLCWGTTKPIAFLKH